MPAKAVPLIWQPVGGVKILRVWEITGPERYPHIALLRVSAGASRSFAQKPAQLLAFLNKNKVFPVKTRQIEEFVLVSSCRPNKDGSCLYVLQHQKTSQSKVVVQGC